ncbi:MAG: hypothetical protein GX288_11740 [Clostridiales bacterium]|nr:hypothetical protein [Clostridiales bacterium]
MNVNRYDVNYNEIISTDEIELILARYNIGKKPLAKLLGWGETTIIRYLEGDIPTLEYSNKLKSILYEPEFYYAILINRKEVLTKVAYRKSKKAVIGIILSSKLNAVAYYIVNKANADISPIYVQYLIYYTQAFSLALYDREMFEEDMQININQVPYLKLYNHMRKVGVYTLDISDNMLSAEDRLLIDAIYDSFTWYGPKALQKLVYSERIMMKISRDRNNDKIISKVTLKAYFNEVLRKYDINEISEIWKYPDIRIPKLR